MYDVVCRYDTEWASDPRPAVAVVHQWMGLGSTEKQHARDLAARGYVGFAVDM
jgi:dienelactone hydrolase